MNLLVFVTLTVTGFVACSEFGSYAFVHPVLRHLPITERITVEKGLLKTFGRVMPVGMTLCVVLAVAVAIQGSGPGWLAWSAVVAFALVVGLTLAVNVPINIATGRWDPANPPAGWERTRRRWEFFQGVRSWLLLIGFLLVCAASTI